MIEAQLIGFALGLAAAVYGMYVLGSRDGRQQGIDYGRNTVLKLEAELTTERAVRHNLNCLVGDLRHEVKELKPDAMAYNMSTGLWCTDQPELIRHHAKKERFFRLGYPEHKL